MLRAIPFTLVYSTKRPLRARMSARQAIQGARWLANHQRRPMASIQEISLRVDIGDGHTASRRDRLHLLHRLAIVSPKISKPCPSKLCRLPAEEWVPASAYAISLAVRARNSHPFFELCSTAGRPPSRGVCLPHDEASPSGASFPCSRRAHAVTRTHCALDGLTLCTGS